MSANASPLLPSLLAQSRVKVERAAAELRAGRPVVILAGGARLAVVALDAAAPALLDAFLAAAGGKARLFLTATRAAAIGCEAPDGALFPVEDMDHAAISRLAYAPDVAFDGPFEAAGAAAKSGVELAKLALLLPALVVAPLGGAETDEAFASCLTAGEDDIAAARKGAAADFTLLSRTRVPLRGLGGADFLTYRGGLAQRDQLAIIVGEPDLAGAVPVRIHSSCITGDLFGSLKCDCGDQLRFGLEQIEALGGGILVYLDQEGRGTGLASKMRAYGLQNDGLDTVEADAALGWGTDERRYEAAVAILKDLGVRRVNLLTNNPAKMAWLERAGIEVAARTPILGNPTHQNLRYLEVKARRAGHMLDIEALRADLSPAAE